MELVIGIVITALLTFIVVWYQSALARAFEPATYVLDGVSVKAKVYGASIKASAIKDASKLEIDAKTVTAGKAKLEQINGFDF